MDKEDLEEIKDEIMNLFYGLMYGEIKYRFDKLHSAMGVDICEEFSMATEDFVFDVVKDCDISLEKLKTLHENIINFGKEYKVKEAKSLAEKVKTVIDNYSNS